MRGLRQQLAEAHERSGLSVGELLAKSGLSLDRSSLQRKLSGDLPMKLDEAEALADAMGVELVYKPRSRRLRRQADAA